MAGRGPATAEAPTGRRVLTRAVARDRSRLDEKKPVAIVAAVGDLRRLAQPDAIRHDIREERFVEHTLQLAIQAALDV